MSNNTALESQVARFPGQRPKAAPQLSVIQTPPNLELEPKEGYILAALHFAVRATLAIALVAGGSAVLFTVLAELYAVYGDPARLMVFQKLIPEEPTWRQVDVQGQAMTLPLGLFQIAGYCFPFFIFIIASFIGSMLISRGIALLAIGKD